MSDSGVIARVTDVVKTFGGVPALGGVSLELHAGEVHALCGENGAGKSTLIKILSGYYAPDGGTIEVGSQPLPPSTRAASELGVSVIHQESVACLDLDAVDNIFIGREPRRLGGLLIDRPRMFRQAAQLLETLGETIPLDTPLSELTVAQRQMVSMARALSQECRLLILDEPTASLSEPESAALFRIIRQLRSQGVAILYVSHRLPEIFALADRATVLRDGKLIATQPIAELTQERLVELMVGREIEPIEESEAKSEQSTKVAPRLAVTNLSAKGAFADVSFSVAAGEVVGLAGLVGAGRSEVAEAIFGCSHYDGGTVAIDGQTLPKQRIDASIRAGLALVPEDRQHEGLVLPMTVSQNLTLVILRRLARWGLISSSLEKRASTALIEALRVKTASPALPAEALSGGNQQKLVLGKWLAAKPRVLILDEPTRGVDVAAKAEIHHRIRQLKEEDVATLVISSELPEVLRLSDRVLVMREGRIAGELSRAEATEQKILQLALPATGMGGNAGAIRTASPTTWVRQLARRRETWIAGLLALIVAYVGILYPSFLTLTNLLDVAADAAPAVIVASALTLVVVTGEIDISVGSIIGLSAAVLGICSFGAEPLMPVPWGILCTLATALGIGLVNGLLVTQGGVPSIIATLGMLTAVRGITELVMKGNSIDGRPDSLRELATGTVLGVPNSVWIASGFALMAAVVAVKTPLGRRIYAVGSNPKSAPLLGLSVGAVKMFVFALSGLMAGVAAILLAPKNSLIQSNLGEGFELLAVTCVVVGGASIRGGRGTIGGTVLAVLLLSLVPTALIYVGAPPQWRLAIQGAFILAAVLIDHFTHRSAAWRSNR